MTDAKTYIRYIDDIRFTPGFENAKRIPNAELLRMTEAVLGGNPCQPIEQRKPETTPNDEQPT